ncbi:MAG: hypothetical protein IPP71_21330 [Bacteroidetes bacterium]|nr:hypothetical protein [Bacteroidota bacterium]
MSRISPDTDTTINATSILLLGGLTFNKLDSKFSFIKNVSGDCKDCYRETSNSITN